MSRSDRFGRFAATDAVSGDLKRKSVLGALATGAGGGLDLVLRLGSTLILARLLVPEYFGLVAMVTAVTRIAERFATLGLSTATVQAPKITDGQCSNLFWINVGGGAVFAGGLVLLSPAIAGFYEEPRLQAITVALSTNFLLIGLRVQHEALLRRQMKLPELAANRLIASLVSLSLAVALAVADFGYWALVSKEVAQLFFTVVGVWILCPWRPRFPRRNVEMSRLLSFGRDMALTQLLVAVAGQVDNLLIGRFGGATVLGLYRQAHNLIMQPVERLKAPIYSVSQPGLSILQRQPGRYRRYYQRILFIVSFATVPMGVFTVIYASDIVLVLLGDRWLGSVVFLQIFGVVAAILPASASTGIIMITCGRTARFLVVSVVNSAVLAILMLAGIAWGAVGIASARAITVIVVTPWALHYGLSGTPVSSGDFLRSYSRPCLAAAVMGIVLLAVRRFAPMDSALTSLALGLSSSGLVYLLALFALPGGGAQLRSLYHELVEAIRRRSSAEIEATK